MLSVEKRGWVAVGAGTLVGLVAILVPPALGQVTRGPRDFVSRDQYGNRYRDEVFDDRNSRDDYSTGDESTRRPARSGPYNRGDDGSYSDAYPSVSPRRHPSDDRPRNDPVVAGAPRTASRYRRPIDDGIVRNDYAGAPVRRHYYGGVDRYDSPDYLDDAGRASALSNGYSRRGVEEFQDAYGRGVRTNDVYPLARDVDPRRYRGRDLNGPMSGGGRGASGGGDIEDFVRSELSVRPGANLRVSSTGTYTYRNYIDQGNQVHARFRQPIHKRWEY